MKHNQDLVDSLKYEISQVIFPPLLVSREHLYEKNISGHCIVVRQ
tara:strand:+ start:2937 stop:3071 length:135 start_codon:yes stop_codon:yes gene_type:complete